MSTVDGAPPTSTSGTKRVTPKPMSLWRLEWLRLVRTSRLVGLAAVYLFLGLTAPPFARYLPDILSSTAAGDLTVIAPEPRPVDGIGGYASNAIQIGLLAFAFVVSSSVTVGSQREMAVFLRTRVSRYRDLLVPKYVTAVAAGSACFLAGTIAAWLGTIGWLGALDVGGLAAGAGFGMLYLAFVGAIAAAVGARVSSVVATAVVTLAVALALGVVGSIAAVGEWLPSHLAGALTSLATDGDVLSYLPATAVTVAATIGLLVLAAQIGQRREI